MIPSPASHAFPVSIRPARQDEANFVLSGWMRSYREDRKQSFDPVGRNPQASEDWYPLHRTRIQQLLVNARCLVAADQEDDTLLYGFAVHELRIVPVLHYLYVKLDQRHLGVAGQLLTAAGIEAGPINVSSWTRAIDRWRVRGRRVYPYFLMLLMLCALPSCVRDETVRDPKEYGPWANGVWRGENAFPGGWGLDGGREMDRDR